MVRCNPDDCVRSVGSREDVWEGLALKTKGGLTVDDLEQNENGRIVSKRVSLQSSQRARRNPSFTANIPGKRGQAIKTLQKENSLLKKHIKRLEKQVRDLGETPVPVPASILTVKVDKDIEEAFPIVAESELSEEENNDTSEVEEENEDIYEDEDEDSVPITKFTMPTVVEDVYAPSALDLSDIEQEGIDFSNVEDFMSTGSRKSFATRRQRPTPVEDEVIETNERPVIEDDFIPQSVAFRNRRQRPQRTFKMPIVQEDVFEFDETPNAESNERPVIEDDFEINTPQSVAFRSRRQRPQRTLKMSTVEEDVSDFDESANAESNERPVIEDDFVPQSISFRSRRQRPQRTFKMPTVDFETSERPVFD